MGTAACLFVYAIGVRLHRAGGTGRLQRIQNHVQQLGRVQLAFGAAFRKIRCEGGSVDTSETKASRRPSGRATASMP